MVKHEQITIDKKTSHLLLLARVARIFPLSPGGKTPLLSGSWPGYATTDCEQIKLWSYQYPDANWAMVADKNVVVIDLDEKHGASGIESFKYLCGQYGHDYRDVIEHCPVVSTPSGKGVHLFFRFPAQRFEPFYNAVGKGIRGGIDIRSGHGYLVATGSTLIETDKHSAGTYVLKQGGFDSIPELPAWLADVLDSWKKNSVISAGKAPELIAGKFLPDYKIPQRLWEYVKTSEKGQYRSGSEALMGVAANLAKQGLDEQEVLSVLAVLPGVMVTASKRNNPIQWLYRFTVVKACKHSAFYASKHIVLERGNTAVEWAKRLGRWAKNAELNSSKSWGKPIFTIKAKDDTDEIVEQTFTLNDVLNTFVRCAMRVMPKKYESAEKILNAFESKLGISINNASRTQLISVINDHYANYVRSVAEGVSLDASVLRNDPHIDYREVAQLQDISLDDENTIYAISAAMGSGKTETLIKHLCSVTPTLILLHRRSLAFDISHRIGAHNYLIDKLMEQGKSLTLVINSLVKPRHENKIDVTQGIILEEAHQLLNQLANPKFISGKDDNSTLALNIWSSLLRLLTLHDHPAMMCDAFLSMRDVEFAKIIARKSGKNLVVYVVKQRSPAAMRTVHLYRNKDQMQSLALACLGRGEPVAYVATTISDAEDFLHKASKLPSFKSGDAKSLMVTGKTNKSGGVSGSDDDPVKRFMDNPDGEASQYKLLIFNSAITSGVSLSRGHFKHLFGQFTGGVVTADEGAQMLFRIRTIAEAHILLDLSGGYAGHNMKPAEQAQGYLMLEQMQQVNRLVNGELAPVAQDKQQIGLGQYADWAMHRQHYLHEQRRDFLNQLSIVLQHIGVDVVWHDGATVGNRDRIERNERERALIVAAVRWTAVKYAALKASGEHRKIEYRWAKESFYYRRDLGLLHASEFNVDDIKLSDKLLGKSRARLNKFEQLFTYVEYESNRERHGTVLEKHYPIQVQKMLRECLIALGLLDARVFDAPAFWTDCGKVFAGSVTGVDKDREYGKAAVVGVWSAWSITRVQMLHVYEQVVGKYHTALCLQGMMNIPVNADGITDRENAAVSGVKSLLRRVGLPVGVVTDVSGHIEALILDGEGLSWMLGVLSRRAVAGESHRALLGVCDGIRGEGADAWLQGQKAMVMSRLKGKKRMMQLVGMVAGADGSRFEVLRLSWSELVGELGASPKMLSKWANRNLGEFESKVPEIIFTKQLKRPTEMRWVPFLM